MPSPSWLRQLVVILASQRHITKLMRFTPWRSFGLRQIAAVRLPRLRISKTLVDMLGELNRSAAIRGGTRGEKLRVVT